MSQVKFEIVKSVSELPPSLIKTDIYSGSDLSIDLFQKYQSVGIGLVIINTHATNNITISIDGEQTFTVLPSSSLPLNDIQFGLIEASGTGTGQIVLKTLKK